MQRAEFGVPGREMVRLGAMPTARNGSEWACLQTSSGFARLLEAFLPRTPHLALPATPGHHLRASNDSRLRPLREAVQFALAGNPA